MHCVLHWSCPVVQSTAEDWYVTGRGLFAKSLYAQAASCFGNANRETERDVALAYQKRKDARAISNEHRRKAAFRDAATTFQSYATGSFEDVRTLRQNAAECFVHCGDFGSAATNFEEARDYTEAAIQYRNSHLLDDVVRLVRPHDGSNSLVADDTKGELLRDVKIQYLRVHDFEYVF